MTIEKKVKGNSVELALSGWLETQSSPMLAEAVAGLPDGTTDITLELSNLEYISSAGVRLIVAVYKEMNSALTLKTSEGVLDVLHMTIPNPQCYKIIFT